MSERKAFVYCGIPGSGKSTRIAAAHPGAVVCSADHYFTDGAGHYHFDAAQLSAAHNRSLRCFIDHCQNSVPVVVCDNTNTTIAEVAPYAAVAMAYGYELQVVVLLCEPEIAAARNVHGVGLKACQAMARRLEDCQFPRWWPHVLVAANAPIARATGQGVG
jgi:predicted kinase